MTLHRTRTFALLIGLSAALPLGSVRGEGVEPVVKGVEPKARQLLDEVAKAYKALPAYADKGEFVLAMTLGDTPKVQRQPLHLSLTRPNKFNIDTGLARVVSDGKTLSTVVNPLKKYTSDPAPGSVTVETVFSEGPVTSALFGGPSAPMMLVLVNLLFGDNAAKAVLDLGETLSIEKDRDLGGKSVRVLKVASESGPSFLLSIDPETKLLRAIDLVFDPKALAESFPPDQKVKIDAYRWTAGEVSTKPSAESVFAFEVPKGFAKVASLSKDEPAAADDGQKFKVNELVGKPAPDFALTILDGKNTKTVSKADLAGKVVLIDFWATWCGPCLIELPEVQKLVESYAKAAKEVVIVALSQDDDPKDPVELRELIEKTLDSKKIVLTGTPVGKIGLDPSNKVGQSFNVEGYPTVVLIDPKGIVRAAHVGFEPKIGSVLSKEIDLLLDGKAVGKEKAEDGK